MQIRLPTEVKDAVFEITEEDGSFYFYICQEETNRRINISLEIRKLVDEIVASNFTTLPKFQCPDCEQLFHANEMVGDETLYCRQCHDHLKDKV